MNLKNMIEALQIVAKYCKAESKWCQAEHDVLYLPIMNDDPLPAEDEARLLELGAHRDSDADCWAIFT